MGTEQLVVLYHNMDVVSEITLRDHMGIGKVGDNLHIRLSPFTQDQMVLDIFDIDLASEAEFDVSNISLYVEILESKWFLKL